jgi:hypothetical protein
MTAIASINLRTVTPTGLLGMACPMGSCGFVAGPASGVERSIDPAILAVPDPHLMIPSGGPTHTMPTSKAFPHLAASWSMATSRSKSSRSSPGPRPRRRGRLFGGMPMGVPEEDDFYIKFLMPVFHPVGAAVGAVWLVMASGRACRPEPTWVGPGGPDPRRPLDRPHPADGVGPIQVFRRDDPNEATGPHTCPDGAGGAAEKGRGEGVRRAGEIVRKTHRGIKNITAAVAGSRP